MANVFISAPDPTRAQVIVDGIRAASAQFDTGYNAVTLTPDFRGSIQIAWKAARDREFDARFPLTQERRLMVLTAGELASLWHLPSSQLKDVPGLFWVRRKASPPPPRSAMAPEGVTVGESIYQGVRRPILLSDGDRENHINIIGKTGMGKTTLMHHVIHQDIAAGKGVAVIDPHGDLFDRILRCSIPPEREEDVVVLDLANPEDHLPLGLFALPEGTSKERAVAGFMQVFEMLFERKWPTIETQRTINFCVRTLLEKGDATVRDIHRLFYDYSFRRELLAKLSHRATVDFWQSRFESLSQSARNRMAAPVLNRLYYFLSSPIVERITCQRASIDFRGIIDQKRILLVNLESQDVSESSRQVLSQLLISKIQMAAWARSGIANQHEPFFLVIDEVQRFTATNLDQLFTEARKQGISLVVGNQFLGQLAGMTLEAVLGSAGTSVIFQCGAKDATALAPYVRPVFDAREIVYLDRRSAIVKTQLSGKSQLPFLMTTAVWMEEPADAQEREVRIRALSRQRYALPPEPEPQAQSSEDQGAIPATEKEATGAYYDRL